MTGVAPIELSAGGHTEQASGPGVAELPGKAETWGGHSTQTDLHALPAVPFSFRSNWQAQMAALAGATDRAESAKNEGAHGLSAGLKAEGMPDPLKGKRSSSSAVERSGHTSRTVAAKPVPAKGVPDATAIPALAAPVPAPIPLAANLPVRAVPDSLPDEVRLTQTAGSLSLLSAVISNPGNRASSDAGSAFSVPGYMETAVPFPVEHREEAQIDQSALAATAPPNDKTAAAEALHPGMNQSSAAAGLTQSAGPGLGAPRWLESSPQAPPKVVGMEGKTNAHGADRVAGLQPAPQGPGLHAANATATATGTFGQPEATASPVPESNAAQPTQQPVQRAAVADFGSQASGIAQNRVPVDTFQVDTLPVAGSAAPMDALAAPAQDAAGSGPTIAIPAAALGSPRVANSGGAAGRTGATQVHLAKAEPAAAGGDASSILSNPTGGRAASIVAATGAGAAAGISPRDLFTALDADPAAGALQWTHAGSRQAEAGFEDPALGWVGVRAGVSGGEVHAALVPGSADAARELGMHMEGLSAYMASQHLPVASMGVASPEMRSAHHGESSLSQSLSDGMGQGARQESNQQSARERGQLFSVPGRGNQEPGGTELASAIGSSPGLDIANPLVLGRETGVGGHISVVA